MELGWRPFLPTSSYSRAKHKASCGSVSRDKMDTKHPFSDDLARLALIYRLPARRQVGRLLVIGEKQSRVAPEWTGDVVVLSDIAGLASVNGEEFDCIAVSNHASNRVPHVKETTLHRLAVMLKPGGILIGSLPHGLSLRNSLATLKGVGSATLRRPWTARRLTEALQRAGLNSVETFYVVPSADAPMALVGTSRSVTRAYDQHAAELTRDLRTTPSYLLRIVANRLGLGFLTFDTLFYWARRSC